MMRDSEIQHAASSRSDNWSGERHVSVEQFVLTQAVEELAQHPVEEATPWLHGARAHGLDTVFVVTPTACDARLATICAQGSGMIYAPATASVTGGQGPLHHGMEAFVARLCQITSLPIGVGTGVSTPQQAAATISGVERATGM
ncbi:tryptophan synthase subunit alpha [Streptomyces sp. NPDC059897]|uniref:tryptophan synthase subunit alpha n=1 Tax=Streptomyces sp. NPDC059897 TaxID=3346994 RepID=UPI003650EADD